MFSEYSFNPFLLVEEKSDSAFFNSICSLELIEFILLIKSNSLSVGLCYLNSGHNICWKRFGMKNSMAERNFVIFCCSLSALVCSS